MTAETKQELQKLTVSAFATGSEKVLGKALLELANDIEAIHDWAKHHWGHGPQSSSRGTK